MTTMTQPPVPPSPGYTKRRKKITKYTLYTILEMVSGRNRVAIRKYFYRKGMNIENIEDFVAYIREFGMGISPGATLVAIDALKICTGAPQNIPSGTYSVRTEDGDVIDLEL